jgi:general secretion pathway protein G
MLAMRTTGRRAHRGFTLIEVLLVLAILLMLAGVLVVTLGRTREGAQIDSARLLISKVENSLERYVMDLSRYPGEEDGGLQALMQPPAFDDERMAERWRGPYLAEEPRDPWGNMLNYQLLDMAEGAVGGKRYRLWSNGPDGQDGTADDIRNWTEDALY